MSFKKNDRVKYRVGLADGYIRGKLVRYLKAGSKVPSSPRNLKTTLKAGGTIKRDMALVVLADGTHRLVGVGYLKKI